MRLLLPMTLILFRRYRKMNEYVSKEQFCKIAHIGKSTALNLIREGLIPSANVGKTVPRYQILKLDVEIYMLDRVCSPEKYHLVHSNHTQSYPGKYVKLFARKMRRQAAALWRKEPDLLTPTQVANLIGYQAKTIRGWSKRGWIPKLTIENGRYHSKASIIQFVGSREFHNIRMKSDKHLSLIRRATNEGM